MNIAIILAAGESKRTKGVNKIFYHIKRKPLIFYTLKAFEKHSKISKIILVVKKKEQAKFSSLIKKYKFHKIKKIVNGGLKRQDSAFNGLLACRDLKVKNKDIILFHNGANPFVTSQEITEVIKIAKKYQAAFIALPAADTVKEVDNQKNVIRTINREHIYLAQTPQAIEYFLAKQAFEKAHKLGFYGTDDVSLLERLGKSAKIVEGNFKNIKITYPRDLELIKELL